MNASPRSWNRTPSDGIKTSRKSEQGHPATRRLAPFISPTIVLAVLVGLSVPTICFLLWKGTEPAGERR